MVSAVRSRPAREVQSPAQVWQATKAIARFVHANGLRRGDRLPPQDELVGMLGISNGTLTRAMKHLVAEGIFARKTGVGTTVEDLSPLDTMRWSVGVLGLDPDGAAGAFYLDLHQRLLVRLCGRGCRCAAYLRKEHWQWPPGSVDFYGLAEDLEEGYLDALVVETPFAPEDRHRAALRDIPVCHVGTWLDAPCGAVIDRRGIAGQAARMLADRGCRAPALISGEHCLLESARQGAAGLAVRQYDLPQDIHSVAVGGTLAREILAEDEEARPDGLIIFDDHVAMGLTGVLAQTGSYRPHLAIQTNEQLPLVFSLPALRFIIDSDELVDRAAQQLRERLVDPSTPERVDWVSARLEE